MRVLLRVAYIGTRYRGFQYQPDVPTVEGVLRDALNDLDAELVSYASRTDAGAHARYQLVSVEGDPDLLKPAPINARLPRDVRVVSRSPTELDPRRSAVRKEYRYVLGVLEDPETVEEACRSFEGEHDFSAFRREDGRDPFLEIERCELTRWGPFHVLRIVGPAFLWEMVRRIAGALLSVDTGALSVDDVERMLEGEWEPSRKPPAAPAGGLILWRVEVDDGDVQKDLDDAESWFDANRVIAATGEAMAVSPPLL